MKVLTYCGSILALATAGCAGGAVPASTPPLSLMHSQSCSEAVPASMAHVKSVPGFRLSSLEGEYRLVMVSQEPKRGGVYTEGRLTLWRTDSLLRNHVPTRIGEQVIWSKEGYRPLWGSTTIDLSRLDAMPTGPLESEDPMTPGVLMEERELQLGIGTLGYLRMDGSTTRLELIYTGPKGFRGVWWHRGFGRLIRDGVETPWPFGYFCAIRTGESSPPDV